MRARRKAFTLIELMTVLTVMSAIFGTMLLTLYAMQKTSHQFTDGIAAAAQQQRFAGQLRVDAHQAKEASIRRARPGDPAATILKLTLADDQTVEYRLFEDGIERRANPGEATVQQESFSARPVLDKGWSLDETRPSPLLTVYLNQNAGTGSDTTPTLIPMRVDAALGVSTWSGATAASPARP
jgi:prepilin-type N-terminal cleavage/methylation domain-containing protein